MTANPGRLVRSKTESVEWRTIWLILATYAAFAGLTWYADSLPWWLLMPLAGYVVCLHGSLNHEVVHGHPTGNKLLNEALIFPNLVLWVPFRRYAHLHRVHHNDDQLTDPYDDPESNFLDGGDWERLPRWLQRLLLWNNTLLGRLILGPMIGTAYFLCSEWRARRDRAVWRGWLWHLPASAAVLAVIAASPMPIWAYLVASYLALSLLRIRTFLEHRAHALGRARTVIIEDRGPLALLFLNNNLHVVHHMHPRVAWYDLPALYRPNRDSYLQRNDSYVYRSYGQIFRQHFWRAKDPVPHPLWPRQ